MADGGGPIPSRLGRTVRSAPTAGVGHPTPDGTHPPLLGQAAEEAHVRTTFVCVFCVLIHRESLNVLEAMGVLHCKVFSPL